MKLDVKKILGAISERVKGLSKTQAAGLLGAGVLILLIATFIAYSVRDKNNIAAGSHPNFFKWLLGKNHHFVGLQADLKYVYYNFEDPIEIKGLQVIEGRMNQAFVNASNGLGALEVWFQGPSDHASVLVENLVKSKNGVFDWTYYESFNFSILNAGEEEEVFTLVISDLAGETYRQLIGLKPGQRRTLEIPVDTIGEKINISKINQFSIAAHTIKKNKRFFIDHIYVSPSFKARREANMKEHPRLVNSIDYGFSNQRERWQQVDPETNHPVIRVPFLLQNETKAACFVCPVSGGVPIPRGELHSAENVQLRSERGEKVAFQAKVLGRWPDESIKWLGLNFDVALPPKTAMGMYLEYGPSVRTLDFESPLEVVDAAKSISVNTGKIKVDFSKEKFFLFEKVLMDLNRDGRLQAEEVFIDQAPFTLSFEGAEYLSSFDDETYQIEVEEKGSQRVVIKASGWLEAENGHRFGQLVLRYYFYPGQSKVRLSHTFIYTGYPENNIYDRYRGLKLPENERVEEFGFEIPLKVRDSEREVLIGEVGGTAKKWSGRDDLLIYQREYKETLLSVRGTQLPGALLSQGWIDVREGEIGMMIGIRDFRENFPKAYKVTEDALQVSLWPKEHGALDLKTTQQAKGPHAYGRGSAFGLAKTHEILFFFHPREINDEVLIEKVNAFQEAVIIRNNPFWVEATGAFGRLSPAKDTFAAVEHVLTRLFDWAERHPKINEWYGMLNFGDVLTWYREGSWNPTGRWGWYNCEGVGLHTGMLLQFARTGEWKYFEFAENFVKHLMDVDTVHYNTIANDPRLKDILDDEVSQVGSMHRHNGQHWGGRNEEATHTSLVGILYYYYLTGNERALDVALEIGEFFLKEPYTYTQHPDIAPHRGIANVLWGNVLLFELTGDSRYKEVADRAIEIYISGQENDGSFLQFYNPEQKTWNGSRQKLYMEEYALGALIAYHELTQDEEVKDVILRMMEFLGARPQSVHGNAYAYFLTEEPEYIRRIDASIIELMQNAQKSEDPMIDGLIYKKPIYHRPNTFLYSVPYAFAALEHHLNKKRSGQ